MRKLSLKELNRLSITEFKALEKHEICLILDNVRSALNVGSAFRTADAFAVKHLYLCGITAQPPHREILKTAIGATRSVDWSHAPRTTEVIHTVRQAGYKAVAVEQAAGSIPLQEFSFQPDHKYALIFGNEVTGIGEEAMDLIDQCIEIPQFGTKHSLNISVTLGILAWEAVKALHYRL